MPPDSRNVINSSVGVRFAAALARTAPPWLGYRLAYFLADRIAGRKKWGMVRAVRANQWMVSDGKLSGEALDRQVQATFRNTARSIYDLHRDIKKGELVKQLAEREKVISILANRPRYAQRGLVVVGIHLSNFDFILQAVFLLGAQGLVLTIPELRGGYQQQFEMRRRTGMELLPTSTTTLRKAIDHLKKGGLVITGMDRPAVNPTYKPVFFGRPSALPTVHIYLALKAQVPLMVGAVLRSQDGTYKILADDPFEMEERKDREEAIYVNAEAACRIAEAYIRRAPEQWSMSFPVWPDVMEMVDEL